MMKISDMIISAVLKKGILYEGRNIDVDVDIPMKDFKNPDGVCECVRINIKAEHMIISLNNKDP